MVAFDTPALAGTLVQAQRQALVAGLRGTGAEVRVLLVCAEADTPRDLPGWVGVLRPGRIEEGLAGLR